MNPKFETRSAAGNVELRGRKICGYAAVFNSLSQPLKLDEKRSFREIVRPGAFAESLAAGLDVMARTEHRSILGRTKNGTLRLMEDARGLRYEIDPPDTESGRDIVELIRRGDVPYSSFAFKVRPDGDAWRREGESLIRELRSVVLIDIAPVASPVYLATDCALRSFSDWQRVSRFRNRYEMRLALAERS